MWVDDLQPSQQLPRFPWFEALKIKCVALSTDAGIQTCDHLHYKRKISTYFDVLKDAQIFSQNVRENYALFNSCSQPVGNLLSADNLCKQFGPRSGWTKHPAWCGSKHLTLWWYSWKNFWKSRFWKITADVRKNYEKLWAGCKELMWFTGRC